MTGSDVELLSVGSVAECTRQHGWTVFSFSKVLDRLVARGIYIDLYKMKISIIFFISLLAEYKYSVNVRLRFIVLQPCKMSLDV